MEEETEYVKQLMRLRWDHLPSEQLHGVLVVDGLSQCGVEFHINGLFKFEWPAASKYLYSWRMDNPAELAELLDRNAFQMIILAGFCGDWEYLYESKYRENEAALQQLNASLKSAVTEKGTSGCEAKAQ
jgi:hypothetical protein